MRNNVEEWWSEKIMNMKISKEKEKINSYEEYIKIYRIMAKRWISKITEWKYIYENK